MHITVVVNCYNSEKFILETANSLSSQTFLNFKVLFVDNKSTDNSFYIFKSNSNFEIEYLETPQFLSLYSARNYALSHIDTEIVCFLDADDLWDPNYLKNINIFHENNPHVYGCQARTLTFNNKGVLKDLTKRLSNNKPINLLNFANMPFPALGGLSIKSKYFTNYRFPDYSNFIGDLDLVLKLAAEKKLYFFNDSIFYYRINPNGLTSSNLEGWKEELDNWLSKKLIILPNILSVKLESDLKYISLRILIKEKLGLSKFLSEVIKSPISNMTKLKLIIRRIINKP